MKESDFVSVVAELNNLDYNSGGIVSRDSVTYVLGIVYTSRRVDFGRDARLTKSLIQTNITFLTNSNFLLPRTASTN